MDLARGLHLAHLVATRPIEFLDRLRGHRELVRQSPARRVPEPDLSPDNAIHAFLGVERCIRCSEFDRRWEEMAADLRLSSREPGRGYDAGVGLARAAYSAVRHLEPERVIETGVSRGITTRLLLEALDTNGSGGLTSIDLPPLSAGWEAEHASAVSSHLRARWTFIRGTGARELGRLMSQGASVDVFIHDSLHTTSNVLKEVSVIWPSLRPGGLVIMDDVEKNEAFEALRTELRGVARFGVFKEPGRDDLVGLVHKVDRAGRI